MAETQTDDQIIHWITSVKKGIEEMSSCLSFQQCVCVYVRQRRGGRGLTWSTDNEDEEREQPGTDTFVLARIPLQTQSNDQLDTFPRGPDAPPLPEGVVCIGSHVLDQII